MIDPYHKISMFKKILMCWSLDLLTFSQKLQCTYGYIRNAWRAKHGLEALPILKNGF